MIRKATSLLLISFFIQPGQAQNVLHSLGVHPSYAEGKLNYQGSRQYVSLFTATATWFVRYNFVKFENRTLSIGIPLGAGIAIIGPELDYKTAFTVSLPLVLDYNIAYKSTLENNATLGCYIGAGFELGKTFIDKNDYSDFDGTTYSGILRAGIRFPGKDWPILPDHGFSIGAFYKKGLHYYNFNALGLLLTIEL